MKWRIVHLAVQLYPPDAQEATFFPSGDEELLLRSLLACCSTITIDTRLRSHELSWCVADERKGASFPPVLLFLPCFLNAFLVNAVKARHRLECLCVSVCVCFFLFSHPPGYQAPGVLFSEDPPPPPSYLWIIPELTVSRKKTIVPRGSP